jgi:hypothetical protein
MGTLSKSPVRVARAALAVAEATLVDYAHRFSPHRFAQPQFFACFQLATKPASNQTSWLSGAIDLSRKT